MLACRYGFLFLAPMCAHAHVSWVFMPVFWNPCEFCGIPPGVRVCLQVFWQCVRVFGHAGWFSASHAWFQVSLGLFCECMQVFDYAPWVLVKHAFISVRMLFLGCADAYLASNGDL